MQSELAPQASLDRTFALATEHHRAGRLAQAEAMYRELLVANPSHHAALFSLSLIALKSGRNEAAAEWLARAVASAPENAAYRVNLGEAYRRLGRHRLAAEALSQALLRKPDFAEAHYNLGLVLQENKEIDGAIFHFDRAADLKPESLGFQRHLAHTLTERGDLATAVARFGCAWLLSGRSPPALDALVLALTRLGRVEEAALVRGRARPANAQAAYERALALEKGGDLAAALPEYERAAATSPDEFRYQAAFARALRGCHEAERSVGHYHCALALQPRSVDVLIELAVVLLSLERFEGAVAMGRRAVALDRSRAPAHAVLGAALIELLRIEEGAASCERAIAIDPACTLAHFQLGYARLRVGEVGQAIDLYRRTIALDPHNHVAHSNLIFLMSYAPAYDGHAILEEARAWARQHAEPLAAEIRPHGNDPTPGRRLRVGYLSPDLHEHPVSRFILPLFESHDRERFAIHGYSTGRKTDRITDRLRSRCDVWRDVSSVDDRTLADRIRQDGVDILVDLAMHTSGGRLKVFARRPAPVQICWLGHVGTTGLPEMDYRITDRFLDPPELGPGPYTEAPLVLPDSIWCFAPGEPVEEVGPSPACSAGYVTFGGLHSFQKIHRGLLSLWSRILRSLPDARLLLHAPVEAQPRTLDALAQEGIARGRVELLPRMPRREYLRAYHKIDVCLDTAPYNGATTSLEALWMGVPVVTLVGHTAVGRAGRSLAHHLGLPELVAETPDEYVEIAVELARDLGRLENLRAGMRARMQGSPLMDAPRFTRNLEAAYAAAWGAWCERRTL